VAGTQWRSACTCGREAAEGAKDRNQEGRAGRGSGNEGGKTIAEVLKWLGADVPPLSLECRHSSQRVQFKLYDREELVKRMAGIEGVPPTSGD
jgi:hypothetical protein